MVEPQLNFQESIDKNQNSREVMRKPAVSSGAYLLEDAVDRKLKKKKEKKNSQQVGLYFRMFFIVNFIFSCRPSRGDVAKLLSARQKEWEKCSMCERTSDDASPR